MKKYERYYDLAVRRRSRTGNQSGIAIFVDATTAVASSHLRKLLKMIGYLINTG